MAPSGRQNLNSRFRGAVREDRATISEGPRTNLPFSVGRRHGAYSGGYLSWSHLAELIGDELRDSDLAGPEPEKWWQVGLIESIIKSSDRVLPSDLHDRQIFLAAVQRVLNSCFDIHDDRQDQSTTRRATKGPHRYVTEFLGAPPKNVPFRPFDFDSSTVGFYRITDWNGARELDRLHVGPVEVRPKPEQDWFQPPDLFEKYLQEEEVNQGSPCPTLVSYEEDTRESANQKLNLYVDENTYYRHVAARRFLRDHPEIYSGLIQRLDPAAANGGSLRELIKSAPSSNIVINVTVQSRDGKVMMMRRQKPPGFGNASIKQGRMRQ